MEKTYANTLENMMVDFENSPFENIETKMAEKIGKETGDKKQALLAMVSKENNLEADELLGDIEYSNKVEAYKCGFRRAINITLDTFMNGGADCE